nr:immunoglobulin light chain junction region [Macaca mulatta]MOW56785.1 immunoglobulin light chain junction region [Macaca mulatta]MOW57370.1 immunoglobulin light chain junction region [Macaca mulatta]MOW57405.1 immunoglobulin light chain junction region [Macaca mulatta]MOW58440.1 immunoglobulin light chain junction region [Macaca mulatta]
DYYCQLWDIISDHPLF